MAGLKAGDAFPEGVTFPYIPYKSEHGEVTKCGTEIVDYKASEEFKNKKVVLVGVPGAFTPVCQAQHLSSFIEKADKLKEKGVEQVAVIAYNDQWVMSAWGKANGIKDDSILFLSDPGARFSKSIGWTEGERTGRFTILVDHGKVIYAKLGSTGQVEGVDADAVLSHL